MVKISRQEYIKDDEKNADLNEFIFDEEDLSVVYEDVPDEDDLPPDWEDHCYESWRDQQRDKQNEDENKIS